MHLDVSDTLRKPELKEAILAVDADVLPECIERINEWQNAKSWAAEAELE